MTPASTRQVLLGIDDHPALLDQLGPLVALLAGDLEWGGCAGSGPEAAELALRAPDALLLDASLPPDWEPERLLRDLAGSGCVVLVLTFEPHHPRVLRLVAAGARGVIGKSEPAEQIAAAIRDLLRDGIHLGADLAFVLLGDSSLLDTLSATERTALELLADGVPPAAVHEACDSDPAALLLAVCDRLG